MHPSLATLPGKANEARAGLEESSRPRTYSQQRDANPIDSGRLRNFSQQGDQDFKILNENILTYKDKSLETQQYVQIEKDAIVTG